MHSGIANSLQRISDPYRTPAEYVALSDHDRPAVRLWALEAVRDLGLDVPAAVVERRLRDPNPQVAMTAAELAGARGLGALADELLARLRKAEDGVGAMCAKALAELNDRRLLAVVGERAGRPAQERDPLVWLALGALGGPQAAALLREALGALPSRGFPLHLGAVANALLLADPVSGVPAVVDRWLTPGGPEAEAVLDGLLLGLQFTDGSMELGRAMEPGADEGAAWLPGMILDGLTDALPLGPLHQIRKACRKRRWSAALDALLPMSEALAERAAKTADVPIPQAVVRVLRGRAPSVKGAQAQASVGLLLLALDQMALAMREAVLELPEAPEARLRWLLSDAALLHPGGQDLVLDQLGAMAPADAWVEACVRAVERDEPEAPAAVRLLEAWRSPAAVPALMGALERKESSIREEAQDALAATGDPALDVVLDRLARSEDPDLLAACLALCGQWPSRRAVAGICRRFPELFIHAPEALLLAVREIGAQEFLEPLGTELREGEVQAEETFALLCELHGIQDQRLRAVRARLAQHARRLEAENEDRPSRLDLALRCTRCRRTYTYPVREVYVDPEPAGQERREPFIRDRIRCKGCGAEDEYRLAPAAEIRLLAELVRVLQRMTREGEEAAVQGPLRLMKLGLQDGRRLNPREARRAYEADLATRPDDPALHIGYGNVLRFLDEPERAEAAYRRALELDPRAGEVFASLGQILEERGDLAGAQEQYRQCLALGRKGHFYQVKDRRGFLAQAEEALNGVTAALSAHPPEAASAQDRLDALIREDRQGPRVGRNDPCPCGSGRKYKKCCLGKASQAAAPDGAVPQSPDHGLRGRLVEYVQRGLPRAEVHRALHEFFGERFQPETRALHFESGEEAADADMGAFLEYLIHDFRLSTGQTAIAKFQAERGPRLPAEEQAILAEWRDAAVTLLEVLDVEPGRSLTLRDVFTRETFRVNEVRGSLAASRWDLLANRVITVHGERQLSGAVTAFQAPDREPLLSHVTERYEALRATRPDATRTDFFRAEPLIFRRYAEELVRNYRPPEFHTPEGHRLMFGRLRYRIRDDRTLLEALSTAPDFEEVTGPDVPKGARSFAWLRIGPAERWVREGSPPDHGVSVTTHRMDESGREQIVSLASLEVVRGELMVEAFSAERLAWTKGRLAEMAGAAIELRADVVEDVGRKLEREPRVEARPPRPSALPADVETRLVGQMLHRHYTAWLDKPVPALGGRTPRAAAADLALRPKVIQMLREMENQQDHARREGQAWYDVGWMWQALRISRQEA